MFVTRMNFFARFIFSAHAFLRCRIFQSGDPFFQWRVRIKQLHQPIALLGIKADGIGGRIVSWHLVIIIFQFLKCTDQATRITRYFY